MDLETLLQGYPTTSYSPVEGRKYEDGWLPELLDPMRHIKLYKEQLISNYGDKLNYYDKVKKLLPKIQKLKAITHPINDNSLVLHGEQRLGKNKFIGSTDQGIAGLEYVYATQTEKYIHPDTYTYFTKLFKQLPGKQEDKIKLLVIILGLPMSGYAQMMEINKKHKLVWSNVGELGTFTISGPIAEENSIPQTLYFRTDECRIRKISNLELYQPILTL